MLLQRAVDEATELLAGDGGLIALRDDPDSRLRFVYGAGLSDNVSKAWARSLATTDGSGLIYQALTQRRVRSTGDYLADESFPHPKNAARLTEKLGIRSLIVAPMVANEEAAGALAVYSARRDAFDPAQTALVRTLADHAASQLANARLIEALARSGEELERQADTERTLREVAARLAGMRDPASILQYVVDEAARLTRADGARIDVLGEGDDTFRERYGETRTGMLEPLDFADEQTEGAGISAYAVRAGHAVITGDYVPDPAFRHSAVQDRFIERMGIHAAVSAPLLSHDGHMGALTVVSRQRDAFGERDAAIVAALADHLSASMTNARLIEQLGQSREELERRAEAERSLGAIAARIASLHSPAEMFQRIADEAARLLRADGAIVDLIDPATGTMRWSYDTGASSEPGRQWLRELEVRPGEGTFGRAIENRSVVLTADYRHDRSIVLSPILERFAVELEVRSLIAAPLLSDGAAIGAMGVYSSTPSAFDQADAALVGALADHASIAITNARLIERLARSQETLARQAESEHALRQTAADLVSIRDPGQLLQRVVDEISRLVKADGTILALFDREAGVLRWSYDDGLQAKFDPSYVANLTLEIGVGVTGRAMAERRVIVEGEKLIDQFPRTPESDHFFEVSGFRSMIAAPIVGEDGPLGALEVYSTREHAFQERDASVLETFAGQAAISITNARLIEELRRSREELARSAASERALRETTARLATFRDPSDLLQHAVDDARRLLDADGALLDLVDADSGLIRSAYHAGVEDPEALSLLQTLDLPIGMGMFGRAIAERRVLSTTDYLADEAFRHAGGSDELARRLQFRSMVAAPLIGESGALGVLGVYSSRAGAFDDDDIALLGAFADQAAVAIATARLIEELDRSRSQLARRVFAERSLRDIAARLAAIRDPHDLLQHAVDAASQLPGAEWAEIAEVLADGRIHWAYEAGIQDQDVLARLYQLELRVGQGMLGRAVAERQVIVTGDYLADDRFDHRPGTDEFARSVGFRSLVAAPLIAEGDVVGVLGVHSSRAAAFDSDDVALIGALADSAAVAMANARLIDELASSRERLAESERRYRHLVQNSPDLVWSIDGDVKFTFLSDTSERLTGWRPDELRGQHFGAIVHPSSSDVARRDWTEGLSGPSHELRGRLNLLHRDGHAIPAEFIALARFENGKFVGANGSVRDMTERDRLERELRESEARYREILATSPDLIWETDADGVFTFVSGTLKSMIGREPGEVIGHHFEEVLHPDTKAEAYARWGDLLTSPERVQPSRFSLLHRDGHPVPIENYSIGRMEGNVFAGAHGSARDVSERERLERELRDSEARYRNLVQNSPDIVYETDADGDLTYLSDTIELLLGWQAAAFAGQHFSKMVAPSSVAAAMETWQAIEADPGRVQTVDLDLPRRDGTLAPFEVRAIGMMHGDTFAGIHGAARDISERRRLERGLRFQAAELAASEERAHLARELHDSVTQALFSMSLLTRSIELLMERDRDAAKAKLADLRDLQKDALAETRALLFELRPSSLAEEGLIKALRTHTAAVEGRIGLPVLIEADEIGRLPIAVEDALYRIGQEALHNVVKHANARGVRIEIREEPPNLRFVVEDDGVGFDETAIPSGHLGLAGMRARAEKIGARLSVTSRAGRGTRIEVQVPLVAPEAPAASEPDRSGLAPDQTVSDDEAARSL